VLGAPVTEARSVDFAGEVLPIFEAHCFECHGPEKQKSDFRLDLRSAALRGGGNGIAIVSGKPEESPLIAHVEAPDDEEGAMPPRKNGGDRLSGEEIAILREWIEAGASWPDALAGEDERVRHWAWQPLRESGGENRAIDDFVREKLAAAGLAMSPEADRRTLIRRLSFDLHGLPPSPEAIEDFVKDSDPNAYEKLVDAMLDSPHFGERYARHWLDIAHYADTHGFERDKRRDTAWRYRDYVIDAFHSDKPYDRFLKEQIAGDILWPDDRAAAIATGFLAAGPWDFVGQVETKSPVLRRSARSLDLDDMATQVMTATMGMTVNCARCHDHKLDPISQEEYYRFRAVFAGVKREERVISEAALAAYEEGKKALGKRLDEADFAIAKLEGAGIDLADAVGGGNGLGTGTVGNGLDSRSGKVQTRKFGAISNAVANQFKTVDFEFIDGVFVPNGEDGKAEVPVSSTGLTVSGLPTTSVAVWDMIRNGPVSSTHSTELDGIDFTAKGRSLLGLHANAGITFDLGAIREATGRKGMRFTARLGYFGAEGGNKADAWVLVDGNIVVEHQGLKREDGLKSIDLPLPEGARFLTLVSTDGGNGYGHDQVGFGDPKLKSDPPRELSDGDRGKLTEWRGRKAEIEEEIRILGEPPKFYGVVAEKEMPEVRKQRRGNPEAEFGDPVAPGAFATLTMLDPDLGGHDSAEGDRRRALAEWITHPQNPLPARVIANRLWHWHFGQGIVDTPSDFGLGGGEPSHSELLDWLALELKRNDWSLKSIHRLVLMSAAYRQESRYSDEAPGVAVDAGNRLLWRQNPRRIEAEAIRDSVLFVSGKLNPERGGPGFEDFRYTEAYAPIYEYVTADEPKLWRRSIYRYIVRTTPDQFLTTLDCPDPANLTPKRLTTTTPLQSLALYNNDFMLRQARYFAERVEKEGGGESEAQIARAFALAFGRPPSESEMKFSASFVQSQGLFALCRTLLNANEFVYVD
jgi:mono/diheme cytochrome c family protein